MQLYRKDSRFAKKGFIYMPGSVHAGIGTAGSGPLEQRIRLWSGLILFAYVLFHYLNHSLGHISLAAMEAVLNWQEILLDNPVGLMVLYGALICHSALGIWKLVHLGNWRKPGWEWTQIALGLAIPWFLISHIVYTRIAHLVTGSDVGYERELALIWPDAAISQSLLMVIVWLHGCIGIHFWLRIRSWYPHYFPVFMGFFLVIPVLALSGWIAAARQMLARMQLQASMDDAAQQHLENFIAGNNYLIENLSSIETTARFVTLVFIGLVLLIMIIRLYMQRFGKRVEVTYMPGRKVNTAPGQTLLDISRNSGIPHMAVCGGRARCSTCRTLVLYGMKNLSPPTEAESLLLDKLNAGPEIRLACQTRVEGDVHVRPLVPPQSNVVVPRIADPLGWGVERELAIFFLDIREFSQISENTLPYDVVFILNSLFAEVGSAIEQSNGYIDKFMGDGIMAIFGLESSPQAACHDALRAAVDCQDAVEKANRILQQYLEKPIRVGMGLHSGTAIIGRIGRASDQDSLSRLTAIGGTVNIASRLEQATKDLAAGLVVSKHALEYAGIDPAWKTGTQHEISIRNISEPIDVVAVNDFQKLQVILDGNSKQVEKEKRGNQKQEKPKISPESDT
jgi:adenylate cyclase